MIRLLRLGVLISGRGSNLQSLINACNDPDFPAEIVLVISNKADAKGIDIAKQAGIPHMIIEQKFSDREMFELDLTVALSIAKVDLVCFAGFMRIVTNYFVNRWNNRIINIHPSLLPAFPGLDTHHRALEEGVKYAGCTVHFVRAEVDDGPTITRAVVSILPNDTPELLAIRVLREEHRIYPLAIRSIAKDRIRSLDKQNNRSQDDIDLINNLDNMQ